MNRLRAQKSLQSSKMTHCSNILAYLQNDQFATQYNYLLMYWNLPSGLSCTNNNNANDHSNCHSEQPVTCTAYQLFYIYTHILTTHTHTHTHTRVCVWGGVYVCM